MRKIAAITLSIFLYSGAPLAQESDFEMAASVYGAKKAGGVVTQPKIRPDHETYQLHGRIEIPVEGESAFVARLTPSQENEAMYNAVQKSRGNFDVNYFYVVLPEDMSEYYYDNASVGGGFDLVGSYNENAQYNTVLGQEKTAPVFYAKYFELWSAKTVSAYDSCLESVTLRADDQYKCASEELVRQDARLNQVYQQAMKSISDPEELRAKQRLWIKDRDQKCDQSHKAQGQTTALDGARCLLDTTKTRANEVEAML